MIVRRLIDQHIMNLQKLVEKVMEQRLSVIELFVKTFIATEIRDMETFRSGSLELIQEQSITFEKITTAYRCVFITHDEIKKQKRKLIKQEAIRQLIAEAVLAHNSTQKL